MGRRRRRAGKGKTRNSHSNVGLSSVELTPIKEEENSKTPLHRIDNLTVGEGQVSPHILSSKTEFPSKKIFQPSNVRPDKRPPSKIDSGEYTYRAEFDGDRLRDLLRKHCRPSKIIDEAKPTRRNISNSIRSEFFSAGIQSKGQEQFTPTFATISPLRAAEDRRQVFVRSPNSTNKSIFEVVTALSRSSIDVGVDFFASDSRASISTMFPIASQADPESLVAIAKLSRRHAPRRPERGLKSQRSAEAYEEESTQGRASIGSFLTPPVSRERDSADDQPMLSSLEDEEESPCDSSNSKIGPTGSESQFEHLRILSLEGRNQDRIECSAEAEKLSRMVEKNRSSDIVNISKVVSECSGTRKRLPFGAQVTSNESTCGHSPPFIRKIRAVSLAIIISAIVSSALNLDRYIIMSVVVGRFSFELVEDWGIQIREAPLLEPLKGYITKASTINNSESPVIIMNVYEEGNIVEDSRVAKLSKSSVKLGDGDYCRHAIDHQSIVIPQDEDKFNSGSKATRNGSLKRNRTDGSLSLFASPTIDPQLEVLREESSGTQNDTDFSAEVFKGEQDKNATIVIFDQLNGGILAKDHGMIDLDMVLPKDWDRHMPPVISRPVFWKLTQVKPAPKSSDCRYGTSCLPTNKKLSIRNPVKAYHHEDRFLGRLYIPDPSNVSKLYHQTLLSHTSIRQVPNDDLFDKPLSQFFIELIKEHRFRKKEKKASRPRIKLHSHSSTNLDNSGMFDRLSKTLKRSLSPMNNPRARLRHIE